MHPPSNWNRTLPSQGGNTDSSSVGCANTKENMMNLDIYKLSAKAFVGEDLTDDEKKLLREYDAKYKIVRHIVMEKRKHEGFNLVDFQFTPGDKFMDLPILDLANGILKSFSAPSKPLDFGDGTFVFDDEGNPIPQRGVYGNPPHTGLPKRSLID